MKRRISAILIALMLCCAVAAQAEVPQISGDLFACAKQAVVYLSSGEYERLVTLLPFSDVAPSATEWQSFAEGNFLTLGGEVQTEYSVAYWTGSSWTLAVPVYAPDGNAIETLVLTSDDGLSFSGYRYCDWLTVQTEYEMSDYVTWNKEFLEMSPVIAVD